MEMEVNSEVKTERGTTVNRRDPAARRKRIRRLKMLIVAIGSVLVIMPTVLSLIALMQIRTIDRRLGETQSVLIEIAGRLETVSAPQAAESEDMLEADSEEEEVTVSQDMLLSGGPAYGTLNADENVIDDSVYYDESIKKVCLTFDDGPSEHTDEILDILAEYDVKATFFVTGHEGMEDRYRRIACEGHTLGMHSWSHDYTKLYEDVDAFAEDFEKLHSYLYDVTGVDSRFFRFPGGSSNRVSKVPIADYIDYLDDGGYSYFDWNASAEDAVKGTKSSDQIVKEVLSQIESRDTDTIVVLMHDAPGRQTTVDALPEIIEGIQAMDNTVIVPITDKVKPVRHVEEQ